MGMEGTTGRSAYHVLMVYQNLFLVQAIGFHCPGDGQFSQLDVVTECSRCLKQPLYP